MALNVDSGDGRAAPKWNGIDGGRSGLQNHGLWYFHHPFHKWAYNWLARCPIYDESGDGIFDGGAVGVGSAEGDTIGAKGVLITTVGNYSYITMVQFDLAMNPHQGWGMKLHPGMYYVVTGNSGYWPYWGAGWGWSTVMTNSDDATDLVSAQYGHA